MTSVSRLLLKYLTEGRKRRSPFSLNALRSQMSAGLMEEWLKWLMETITISEMKRSVLRLNYCLTIWMILLCVKDANKILCAISNILILVKA